MLNALFRQWMGRWFRRDTAAEPLANLWQEASRHAHGGEPALAATLYRKILAREPDNATALYCLGAVLCQQREYSRAAACFEQALSEIPHYTAAINALGNVCRLQQRWQDARQCYERALQIDPDHPAALSNLGLCLKNEGRAQEAITYLERASGLVPDDAVMLLNHAAGLLDLGRYAEGEQILGRALELQPELAEARIARALLLLGQARFDEAWPEYEWRMRCDDWEKQTGCAAPVWTGGPLVGRTLLVRGEQGLGDQLMFASCLPELVTQAGLCLVECDPRLKPLLARTFPAARVYVQRRGGWKADGVVPDLQVQLGSLPWRLHRSGSSFPNCKGYLVADRARVQYWRGRLDALGPGLKVGISWRGGTAHTRQTARSIPLTQWLPVLDCAGAHFVSLQYGEVGPELRGLEPYCAKPVTHWPEAIADYDETAALVVALDLVITVQTAIVHLAGALGVQTWVLVPHVAEWRYQRAGTTMPWYASVRLFRQEPPQSWQPVVQAVAGELDRIVCRAI